MVETIVTPTLRVRVGRLPPVLSTLLLGLPILPLETDMVTILVGDCRSALKTLPDASVNCCVTSPPYWGLRDYQTGEWEGGEPTCDHNVLKDWDGPGFAAQMCKLCGALKVDRQIGIETTPEAYVENLVAVFREVRRVLTPDGVLWLNLGDSYASGKGSCFNPGGGSKSLGQNRKAAGAHPLNRGNKSTLAASGLKPKDLVGIPWRVAFALQADGWWLRQDIIWHKPNPMPESVTDRCTKAHEYIFLLTKSDRYFFDGAAIREPSVTNDTRRPYGSPGANALDPRGKQGEGQQRGKGGRNAFRGQGHFRDGENGPANRAGRDMRDVGAGEVRNRRSVWTVATRPYNGAHFATFPPELIAPCVLAGCPQGGTVLDPFAGSGTTGEVASSNGRRAVLVELNPEYAKLAQDRCGLFCSPNAGAEARRERTP